MVLQWLAFGGCLLVYFILMAGTVYNLTAGGVPSSGAAFFQVGELKEQQVMEGILAAALFVLGGLGFVLVDRAEDRYEDQKIRLLKLIAGAILVIGCYNVAMVLMRVKLSGVRH